MEFIMKFLKYTLLFLMLLSMAFVLGCGSDPGSDDSDVKKDMNDVEDGKYYVLSHLKGTTVSEEGETQSIYQNQKFITHCKDITLKDSTGKHDVYAVMEYSAYEETKDVENEFFVVYENGTISLVQVDANLLDETVKSANIISEDILCVRELKQGYDWVSPNGTYSIVERYEYVVISEKVRSAPSYKVVTYADKTKSKKLRTVWWTPDIAWCCQWKNNKTGIMDTLTDLDYDWDEDE